MPSNASVMFDGYPLLLNFVSISIRTGIAEERMKVSKQQREDIVVGQQANLVALSYLSIFTFTSAPQVSNHAQQALLIFLLLRKPWPSLGRHWWLNAVNFGQFSSPMNRTCLNLVKH